MTTQSRFLSILLSALLLGMTLTACGGGDPSTVEVVSPKILAVERDSLTPPTNAFEANNLLHTSKRILFRYSAVDGTSINPNMDVRLCYDFTFCAKIIYNGEVIYTGRFYPYRVDHGFTHDGKYVILIKDASDSAEGSRIFINGKLIKINSRYHIDNIVELESGLWVMRSLFRSVQMLTYDPKTEELIEFSPYPFCGTNNGGFLGTLCLHGDHIVPPSISTAKAAKEMYDQKESVLREYVNGQTVEPKLSVECSPFVSPCSITSVRYMGKELYRSLSPIMGMKVRYAFLFTWRVIDANIVVVDDPLNPGSIVFIEENRIPPVNIGDVRPVINGIVDVSSLTVDSWILISANMAWSSDEEMLMLDSQSYRFSNLYKP